MDSELGRKPSYTVEEVLAFDSIVEIWPRTGAALRMTRSGTYQAARTGTFPIKLLKRGRLYFARRVDILEYLGIPDDRAPQTTSSPRAAANKALR